MGSLMSPFFLLFFFRFLFLFLFSFPSLVHSQQPYVGRATTNCGVSDNSTTSLGYVCNFNPTTCLSYLTFHSQPPYNSISSISALLNTDPSQLSQANSVPLDYTFPTITKLFVPVNCSCSGAYSVHNSSYLVQQGDTFFIIANNTYQGLTTCQTLAAQKGNSASGVVLARSKIDVPLRCACPTAAQKAQGVKYLLSYLVDFGDSVSDIETKFGVDTNSVLAANDLSLQNPTIFPFTTLLVPLNNKPNSSEVLIPSPALPSPPSPPPPPPSSSGKKISTGGYVGIGIAIAAVLAIALIAAYCVCCGRAKLVRKEKLKSSPTDAKVFESSTDTTKDARNGIVLEISDFGGGLKEYKYVELQKATDDFSEERRIEGSVYHGMFKGDAAAVKVMSRDVKQEINILKRINHANLVRLSGFCFHQGRWFLIYEYAAMGSLSEWLFDVSGTKVLSWVQRVQIAMDVARGLSYLHNYINPSYVHKDLKCSNILLDASFKAKIANFGLARPAEGNEEEPVLTRHIVGTQGYMAPEYLEHGLISPKLDVYAFGIVMMEMITGKEISTAHREVEAFFQDAFTTIVGKDDDSKELREFLDPLLEGNYPLNSAVNMTRLISECLRHDEGSRPGMVEIMQSLSGILTDTVTWELSKNTSELLSFSRNSSLPSFSSH